MDRVSQLNASTCSFCSQVLTEFEAAHVCPQCGEPQPLAGNETYFTVLNAPMKFSQDSLALEKKFYSVSRILHPDRFTHRDSAAQKRSLERMSLLNDAYRTLKSPGLLREYLLQLKGIATSDPKAIPKDLAEAWFEIQDMLVSDDLENMIPKLNEFSERLKSALGGIDQSLAEGEKEFDSLGTVESLHKIGSAIHVQNYLKSLMRNVIQLRHRLEME